MGWGTSIGVSFPLMRYLESRETTVNLTGAPVPADLRTLPVLPPGGVRFFFCSPL